MPAETVNNLIRMGAEISGLFPRLYLAGGTAVMLKHGHRMSYDLDFFSETLTLSGLESRISAKFGKRIEKAIHFPGGDNLDLIVEGIRVSFVRFPFKNIKPVEVIRGIRIASDLDLFLNKTYAAGRRVESKDVLDLACLINAHPDWKKDSIKAEFKRKFREEKFEIYFSSALSFEDYPDLAEETKRVLEDWYGKN